MPSDGMASDRTEGPACAGPLRFRWGRDALLAALGHLLAQHPWAADRLRMHAGRVVQMELAATGQWPESLPLPPPIRIAIERDGAFGPDDGSEAPAVRMIVRPSLDAAFALWREGMAGLQQHLRIEGDVMLAATVAELAQKLRWDWEDDLSRLLGDVAAHRVGLAVRAVPQGLGDLAARLTRMLSAGLDQGEAPIIGRGEFEFHRQDLDAMVSRVDALEAALSRGSRSVSQRRVRTG